MAGGCGEKGTQKFVPEETVNEPWGQWSLAGFRKVSSGVSTATGPQEGFPIRQRAGIGFTGQWCHGGQLQHLLSLCSPWSSPECSLQAPSASVNSMGWLQAFG